MRYTTLSSTPVRRAGKAAALALLLVLALAPVAHAAPGPWKIDASHTSINFNVRHLMVSKVRGYFSGFEGDVKVDEAGKLTWAKGKIKVKSINTGHKLRDQHLMGKEFFDGAKFPHMTFESTSITHDGDKATVDGKLTIKGVTRTVRLTGEYLGKTKLAFGGNNEEHVGYTFQGRLNRQDFGLTFNGVTDGKAMVDDWVNLDLEVELARKL